VSPQAIAASPGKNIPMTPVCRHARVEIISQDENGKFVECLDCREIYEAAELDEQAAKEGSSGQEAASLSDA
jgi:hypothetical protein